MSKSHKGKILSEEHKIKIAKSLTGRKLSTSHLKNMSNAKKGKSCSEEHKKRISDTLKKKWKTQEFRESQEGKRSKTFGYTVSKAEKLIWEILDNKNIEYDSQFRVDKYVVDFYFKSRNLIIEYFGDYWHANPELYEDNDIISYPNGKFKAKDVWSKDKKRIDKIKSYGFDVHIIWEKDFITNGFDFDIILKHMAVV